MPTILVIDDEAGLRINLHDVLSFEGFTVIEAENGIEGLQKARDYDPDFILCDIAMPGLDGYQVLRNLRDDPQTANIPVILLTAKADKAAIDHGISLGATEYISKPFTFQEILAVIRRHLGE